MIQLLRTLVEGFVLYALLASSISMWVRAEFTAYPNRARIMSAALFYACLSTYHHTQPHHYVTALVVIVCLVIPSIFHLLNLLRRR